MRFHVHPHDASAEGRSYDASNWFDALRQHLAQQGSEAQIQQFKFSIDEDGYSARVTSVDTGEVWWVRAELQAPGEQLAFVSRMRKSFFLWKPYGWLFVLAFVALSVPVYFGLGWLRFPEPMPRLVAVLLGLQASGWLWLTLACKVGTHEQIERTHWQGGRLLRKGLVLWLLALGVVGLAGWMWGAAFSIWADTAVWTCAALLFLWGLHTLLTAALLQAEIRGKLSPGRVRRSLSWLSALLVSSLALVGLLWIDFVAGMYWWHGRYVTSERRRQVATRAKKLRSLQLKTLVDRRGKELGLFARTHSDWSPYYNDPKLLQWKVSQAIRVAEGEVPKASWWWRYLPDGSKLLSEPFSVKAFMRVPYYFLKQRRKVGGSTPALQAAKNFLDFGQARRNKGLLGTIGVKLFDEIPRAYIMAQRFTPREMMAMYMATVWAGKGGNYGLHRMSLYYFAQPNPGLLDWNQAAVLAASLPNPGRLNPWYLRSCWEKGLCRTPRKARVYKVWRERIKQIKQQLRRGGVAVPPGLPPFRQGMSRLRMLSRKWQMHDAHLRSWIRKELPTTLSDWNRSSSFQLSYDRHLTLGTGPQPAKGKSPCKKNCPPQPLVLWLQSELARFRQKIPDLQIAYTLVDARDGMIASQYGGDGHVDMAHARKPVVGSTFKVLTMLISGYWPDAVPLLNQGQNSNKPHQKSFVYQPQSGSSGHVVRNSHGMARYVSKQAALTMSANIGFVFMSLRWTWFLDGAKSKELVLEGLSQMYEERMKLDADEARSRAESVLDAPEQLLRDLREHLGHRSYLRRWRSKALFEAAKAATIREALRRKSVHPRSLTTFLDASSVRGFGGYLQGRWAHHRAKIAARWKARPSWEQLSWVPALRMELGLRYIIRLARDVAGFDPRRDNLKPVLTMTLGVNDAGTHHLASVAATVAAGRWVRPRIIREIRRGARIRYRAPRREKQRLPIPPETLPAIQKAMNGALRWGTAARSGRLVAARFGTQWLLRSGAKTGTVQRSKGVSCVGYMGHYAGALSISTPRNRPLVQYILHKGYLQRRDSAKKQLDKAIACLKQEQASSRKRRRCESLERWWRKRYESHKALVEKYQAQAHTFIHASQVWHRSQRKAAVWEQKARILGQKAALKRRQAAIYRQYAAGDQRMIALYDRWFQAFDKRQREGLKRAQQALEKAEKTALVAEQQARAAGVAVESHKQVLAKARPTRSKSRALRLKWRALVRQWQRLRYRQKRARYKQKVAGWRRKAALRRRQRFAGLLEKKVPQYHQNLRKKKHNLKRLARWKAKLQDTLQQLQALESKQAQAQKTQRIWLRRAAREEAQHQRLEAAVKRTHSRWSLYSSDACYLLFSLLAQWKDAVDPKGTP